MSCPHDHSVMKTQFCPHCGYHVAHNPIAGLRAQIASTIRSQTTILEENRMRLERAEPKDREYRKRKVDSAERAVKKWTSWLTALDELIGKDS